MCIPMMHLISRIHTNWHNATGITNFEYLMPLESIQALDQRFAGEQTAGPTLDSPGWRLGFRHVAAGHG